MLNHGIDFGLIEVHPPRLNAINCLPPLELGD
jgi:hypothetical protein